MRLLILYHSGTGNTEFACEVAKIVAERAGHEVTMKRYKDSADLALEEYDAFCFAAPVYEWAPARNVERFLEGMPSLDSRCAFMLTSSAGAKGQATSLFARMLTHRGLVVLGDYNLICPDSWGPTRRWAHEHEAETPTVESIRELAAFVEKMLNAQETFIAGKKVDIPDYKVKPTGLYFASRFSRIAPTATVKMGRKKVDPDSCDSCGVCVKKCPTGAIMLGPYPTFTRECIGCWSCINTCPNDSITTGIDSRKHYKGIVDREGLLERAGLK